MYIISEDDLFQSELQKLYSMENQIMEAVPLLLKHTHSQELKKALTEHLSETKNQAKRLEDVGAEIDLSFDSTQDVGIKGILEESKLELEEVENPQLKDLVIIGGSEKVEHYEMAAYESAIELAKKLGMDQVASTFEETYGEEKRSAELLKKMAGRDMSAVVEKVKAVL